MGFIATQVCERGFEKAVLATSAGIGQTRFELLALRARTAGEPMPERRQCFALLKDVEDVAVTRRIGPGHFLPGTQTGSRIGNRVLGIKSLCLQVQQMDGPGIAVAMRFGSEQIAIGRDNIDAGEYGLRSLKEFVVQGHW